MAIKYKKISPCIWNDAKVAKLSVQGKLAFVYLLTHPQQTSVGAIRTTIQGLSFEVKDLHMEAFAEVFAEGLAEASDEAPLIIFPNFLKYNHPESPNVANAWGKSFLDLPDCKLKNKLYSMVCQTLKDKGKGFEEGFSKGLGKDFGYSVPLSEAEAEAEAEEQPLSATQDKLVDIYTQIDNDGHWNCPACDFLVPGGVMECQSCKWELSNG